MEISIQKELKEVSQFANHLSNDTLEAYLDYAALYSKESWIRLQAEFLRRMELQIAIL